MLRDEDYIVTVVVQDDVDFETVEEAEKVLKALADLGFYDASIILRSIPLLNREELESKSFGDICHKGVKNVEK